MCLSIPGKVIEIKENGECIVDYETEKRTGKILTKDIKIGDYVILSNKIVVMKVPKEQAQDYLNAIKETDI
jgi:hydrogenase maturation factor